MYIIKVTVDKDVLTAKTEERKLARAASQVAALFGWVCVVDVEVKPRQVKFKGL